MLEDRPTSNLEKLQPSYDTLKERGEEMIARSEGADKDISAKGTCQSFHRTESVTVTYCVCILFEQLIEKSCRNAGVLGSVSEGTRDLMKCILPSGQKLLLS